MGDGDGTSISVANENGALCGSGDISIMSISPGDDDSGNGGVVTYSAHIVRTAIRYLALLSASTYHDLQSSPLR
jgi:hypothetical protein